MNVYDIFWSGWPSDNERLSRMFELYECFLVNIAYKKTAETGEFSNDTGTINDGAETKKSLSSVPFCTVGNVQFWVARCQFIASKFAIIRMRECKCLTGNQKPTGSQFSLLHEPN